MRKLTEIQPGEIAVVDCIDIKDEPYHTRINRVGLKCEDQVKCIRSSYGMKHLAVGQGFTTEFALRNTTCEEIWIR